MTDNIVWQDYYQLKESYDALYEENLRILSINYELKAQNKDLADKLSKLLEFKDGKNQ